VRGIAPLTTPGCIVKVKHMSLAFECSAEPTHAGLVLINDQVFLAFACLEHKPRLIAARRMREPDILTGKRDRTNAGGFESEDDAWTAALRRPIAHPA